MRVTGYLNTTKEDVDQNRFNIFCGLSLGNKYLLENIGPYLKWALTHTKERVAVLIPDKLQAVNYEVKSGYSPTRALTVALRKGEEIDQAVRKTISTLALPADKISIYRWADIEEDSTYLPNLAVIHAAFQADAAFRSAVVSMVKETPHLRTLNLPESDYVRLAKYILDELPILVTGFEKGGVAFDLLPYPGFAALDYLAIDLQEGKLYPHITEQLQIPRKLSLIEAYAD